MDRFLSLFPQGFDSCPPSSEFSGSGKHHTHSTEELKTLLLGNYNPLAPSESINVKSAWYGKQTDSTKHEFILIQIEDHRPQQYSNGGLVNYLVLDRNVSTPTKPGKSPKGKSKKSIDRSQVSIQGGDASDTFRVSYDGDVEKLLKDCDLMPHRLVEQICFPSDNPLPFYELVTLACGVSHRYPKYNTLSKSCYFFAGLVWEVLCGLRPNPTLVVDKSLDKEKGKHGWYRFTVERRQVEQAHKQTSGDIEVVRLTMARQKKQLEDYIQKQANYRMQQHSSEAENTATSIPTHS